MEEWEKATQEGMYTSQHLEKEGFIHCADPHQIIKVANSLFQNQTGLAILAIDPTQVSAEIKYEDLYNVGEDFPHIYGPLNIEAVICVSTFGPENDGTFRLPTRMKELLRD